MGPVFEFRSFFFFVILLSPGQKRYLPKAGDTFGEEIWFFILELNLFGVSDICIDAVASATLSFELLGTIDGNSLSFSSSPTTESFTPISPSTLSMSGHLAHYLSVCPSCDMTS